MSTDNPQKNPHAFSHIVLISMWIMWITICPTRLFAHFYDVSGTHSYQQIAVYTIFQKKMFQFHQRRGNSKLLHPLSRSFSCSVRELIPRCVGLSGGIDVGQHHLVRQGQGLGKFRPSAPLCGYRYGAGIHTQIVLCGIFPAAGRVAGDLRGMVGIVIHNGDTAQISPCAQTGGLYPRNPADPCWIVSSRDAQAVAPAQSRPGHYHTLWLAGHFQGHSGSRACPFFQQR